MKDSIAIVRQPVFDDKRRIWGYALHCLGTAPVGDRLRAENLAVDLAGSAYIGLQQIMDRNKKVVVNFNEKNILGRLPYAFPPTLTVVLVTEDIYRNPSVPPVLRQLKSDGYLLAVTGECNEAGCDALFGLADIIGIEVAGTSDEVLAAVSATARAHGLTQLAMQVTDKDSLEKCRAMGFDLFHGPFFKTLETVTDRKLSSNEIARFNLLHTIEKEEVDFEQLAETIQSDPALSFRLLSYLNSAGFGLRQKIQSVHQAVSLLGWRKMKNWLRVVLLNDVNQSKDAPELMLLATQRGKFLELVAQAYDFWGFNPESLHLLGIFSLLDVMLGAPMAEVIGYLPLDDKLEAALCRQPNNEYVPLLELAECFEEGRWEDGETRIRQLNMDAQTVRHAFQQAIDWAEELTVGTAAAVMKK